MNKTSAAGRVTTYYTNPNTGQGIPCTVLDTDDDGKYTIKLPDGAEGWVTAGDLYLMDESGRYLGGPTN